MEELIVRLEHAWIVLVSYSITEDQAAESLAGTKVTLTDDMRLGLVGPACYYCQEHYLNAADSCPGAPSE